MIHKLADCQAKVPESTNIWQFCVVLPGAKIGENCNICSHCFIENNRPVAISKRLPDFFKALSEKISAPV